MSGKTDSAAAVPAPGFGAEFLQCWNQVPDKGLFFTLLAAWLLLFQFLGNCTFGYIDTASLLHWMYNAYTNGDEAEEHGLWIPVLVLGLMWWKRQELLAAPKRPWYPALLLLGAALAMHTLGYLVQQQRISIVAMFLGIYALIGLAWGPAVLRAVFFPFFLLAFCIPISTIATPVTFPLRLLVCRIVEQVAPFLGFNVIRDGTSLLNAAHTYKYEVAAACSGLHSVVAILCIATVFAFVSLDKNWKRLLMMASAFPLSVFGNVIRMLCIIVAAEVSGQSAGDFVHKNWFFSLVPYIPAIAGVMFLGRWLQGREPEAALPLKAKTA